MKFVLFKSQVSQYVKHKLTAEKTWKVLNDAIHEINNHNASGLSFEELYRQAISLEAIQTAMLQISLTYQF